MDRDSVALSHLLEVTIRIHDQERMTSDEEADDFVDFTDDEIRSMVRSLWAGRNTSSRLQFREAAGEAVLRWVKQ